MSEVRISGLFTYPVKSFAGIELASAEVTRRGLIHDRSFMVVDSNGDFLSQRRVPEMALVIPSIGERAMTLSSEGMESVEVSLDESDASKYVEPVSVHGNVLHAKVVEKSGVTEWLNDCLPHREGDGPYRLVRVAEAYGRSVKGNYAHRDASNILGFADGFPILLTSASSLARLNKEMIDAVPMDRFRPNIVVEGDDLPAYDEDFWEEIQVGVMHAIVAKACDRCMIPDVDQSTGQLGNEVRRALVTRKGANAHDARNTGVFFGQNLNHIFEPGMVLNKGDEVKVISRSKDPNVVLSRT